MYQDEPTQFSESLKQSDYLITARLHGMILGFLLDIPVSMISYRRKFEDFADTWGIVPPERRFSEDTVRADEVMDRLSYYPYAPATREKMMGDAKKNFEVISPSILQHKEEVL